MVAYDTAACGPLATVVSSTGRLGCALVVNSQPSASTKHVLRWQMHEHEIADCDIGAEYAFLVDGNAMAPALPLFEAFARTAGRVHCAIAPTMKLEMEITAMDGQAVQVAP